MLSASDCEQQLQALARRLIDRAFKVISGRKLEIPLLCELAERLYSELWRSDKQIQALEALIAAAVEAALPNDELLEHSHTMTVKEAAYRYFNLSAPALKVEKLDFSHVDGKQYEELLRLLKERAGIDKIVDKSEIRRTFQAIKHRLAAALVQMAGKPADSSVLPMANVIGVECTDPGTAIAHLPPATAEAQADPPKLLKLKIDVSAIEIDDPPSEPPKDDSNCDCSDWRDWPDYLSLEVLVSKAKLRALFEKLKPLLNIRQRWKSLRLKTAAAQRQKDGKRPVLELQEATLGDAHLHADEAGSEPMESSDLIRAA